jgi:hypothetical protein
MGHLGKDPIMDSERFAARRRSTLRLLGAAAALSTGSVLVPRAQA